MGLSEDEQKILKDIWARYHDGGLKDLPPQVYFDVGWMMAIIDRLGQPPPVFEDPARVFFHGPPQG